MDTGHNYSGEDSEKTKSGWLQKLKQPWTPIIFRCGFLYDYKRTILMAATVTLVGLIISIPLEVTLAALTDTWTVMWFLVWMGATYFVRQAVKGLVCLFGVPDETMPVDAFYSKESIMKHKCVKSHEQSLAYSIAMGKAYEYSPEKREPVPRLLRALFDTDENFNAYRQKVADALYSIREIPIGIAAFFVFFFMWWGPTSIPWDFHGALGVLVDFHWWFTTAFWFFECLLFASFFNIYYAMLKGTHLLSQRPKGLRIYNYLQFLDKRGLDKDLEDGVLDDVDDEVVDLDIFTHLTKPIGNVFTDVTLGFIAVIVAMDVYWTIVNTINNVPLAPIAAFYPFFGMGLALLMFILPQYGVHRTLASYKTLIGERLIRSRMFTNTRLIKGTSSLPPNVTRVDQELEPYIRLHKTALDILDSMIEKLKSASTWTFDLSTISRFSIPIIFESILKVSEYILRVTAGG